MGEQVINLKDIVISVPDENGGFKEIARAESGTATIQVEDKCCPECEGTGRSPWDTLCTCYSCDGTGDRKVYNIRSVEHLFPKTRSYTFIWRGDK